MTRLLIILAALAVWANEMAELWAMPWDWTYPGTWILLVCPVLVPASGRCCTYNDLSAPFRKLWRAEK